MNKMTDFKQDVAGQVLMNVPTTGVAAATFLGFTVNDWLVIGAVCLTALQLAYVLRKWYLLERGRDDD
ncbi:hypothetical protein D9M71_566510 [compost metagenome]